MTRRIAGLGATGDCRHGLLTGSALVSARKRAARVLQPPAKCPILALRRLA